MKVATRLALGFGSAVVLGVIIAMIGAVQMRGLSGHLDEMANNRMVKVEQFSQLKDNLNSIARYVRNILISKDPAFEDGEKRKIAELRGQNSKLLEALEKSVTLPQARELLKAVTEQRSVYNKRLDDVMALDAKGDSEEASKLLLGEIRDRQNVLFKAVDDSTALQRDIASRLAQEANASASSSAALLIGLAAAIAVIGVAITWLLVRSLARALGAEPDELGQAAQRVAAGGLGPVPGASAAPAGSVLASLGDMQSSLARIVGQVRSSSDSIATGSAQIATGNADLSQRTEEQAANLEQTAASMEQLSSTVKNNADTAGQASELASSASAAAVKGGEMVGHVVSTMQDIAAASKKIADIIGVIDGIAFQTNILALNAAVEAARAGEQGRGFAVVASEVRSLAGRSAQAAKEIKSLIGASVDKVETGARQVDDAGASMHEIVTQVRRVSQMISEISNATSEQSSGIGQMGDAVAQLDQVTQQNAALVEESAAAAESLKHQAAQLAHLVSVFDLGDGAAATAAAPAAPAMASAPTAVGSRFADRRGPNRATNVTRPAFRAKAAPAATDAADAAGAVSAKAGTEALKVV